MKSLACCLLASLTLTGSAFAESAPGVITLVGQWDGFAGSYADVWGDGEYAYLAHFGSPSIDIIDISDPTNPVLAAFYPLQPPNDSASAQDVKVADGLLFIGLEGNSSNSVHIVDVRDPGNPVGIVDIALDGFLGVHNVFYDQGWLYIATSNAPEVRIVDLRNLNLDNPPPAPITTAAWTLDNIGSSVVHDVTVVNGRLYASAWNSGIWVYDVSKIATSAPEYLADGPGQATHSAWPTSDGEYVITGEERSGGGIKLYRTPSIKGIGKPMELLDEKALPTNEASSVHNQVVIGDRVYNSWYGAGLRIYDVNRETEQLDFIANFDTNDTGSVWGVYPFLGPNRILLSSIQNGLFIVDATDTAPGDVDGDGQVTIVDLLQLLSDWGACANCASDLDNDGEVGIQDLLEFLALWN